MKKILTLLMLGGVALAANAQQINGDFDGDWKDCVPWTSDGNKTIVSAQPEGWHISNVCVNKSIAVGSAVEGSNNTRQAVHLTNQSKKIPAYLTLGTPWATAQVRYLWYDVKDNSTDGGTWGGIDFAYHPDAIAYEYKRDNSKGDENATVIAYLWKGTWTQKNVPGNPTWNSLWWYVDPTYVDMNDRERNVLGMQMQGTLGGEVTHTNDAKLLASLQKYITNSTKGEWVSDTIPFDYKDMTSGVEKVNVIFSATDYFGNRNNIVDGNSLTVDNVRFVYYHALDTLATTDSEGKAIALNEKFAADRYNYTVNAMYDANKTKVPYTKKGVAATVDTKYDEATRVFSIIVKGEDYDAVNNPSAISTYTIKYKKPAPTLTSLVVAGKEFISAGKDDKNFTANGKYNADEVSYKTSSETAKVNTSYDKVTGKLTITVEDEESMTNVYTITFNGKEKVAFYQIPNADFENWGETALAETWNSFESATGSLASFASMSPKPEKIDGFEGYGVRIKSKDLSAAYANGNITTGRINMGNYNPADASNYNFTDLNDINGSLPFTGTPDAFEVYARFAPGTAKNEGTVLQGRVQLIVHGEVAYHDPELSEQAANKIASASVLIPATADWTKFTSKFSYTGNESGKQYLLASATTNPVPGASKDDQLDLDNLKLIYYHTLESLTTTNGEGKAIALNEKFAEDCYNYTVNAVYDANKTKVSYTKKGIAATVDTKYDEATRVFSIIVEGNDYDAQSNPSAISTYTIKYKKPAPTLTSLVVAGKELISAGKDDKNFTAAGKYQAGEVSYKASSETAKVNASYDKFTGKLTITVEDEETLINVYTITFEEKEKAAFYQIPNADFENWGETALAETWNSFESATGKYASFASYSPKPEKIDGFEGFGVRIKSQDLSMAYANGNITTGRINMGSTNPANASNYNFTDLNDVRGNLPFTGTPDAFEVYARFAPGKAKNEGTVLQGRVQLIVHGEVAYRDPELSEQAANKIASAAVLIPATADWTKFTGEFNYTGNESDNLYLLASATTNPVPGASKDDQLDLDNIKLIYYHALSNLTFNGVKLAGFSADKTDYTVTIDGDVAEAADKIKYVVKGRGASATTDLEGDVLTITVNGNDYAANAESQTVYTVKFEKKVVDGINSISADYAKNHKVYTLSGVRVNGKPAAGVYIVDGKKVVIK